MLHVVLHVCCMCVACVLHVRCMAGVQDRAVTLSKWRACHAERQPVHPTTLRNQVKKVSRLSLHVFHLAQPILAHMRPRKQTDTPTHKHPPKLIPMLSLTQCRHHSRVCLQPWVHPIVSFLSPVRLFFGSEFSLTVVDMHVDVDQHTYTHTHIDATTSASEIYALSKHALL